MGPLAAFSGGVGDDESRPAPLTATSQARNPGLKGRDIADAFQDDGFKLPLVANTGARGVER